MKKTKQIIYLIIILIVLVGFTKIKGDTLQDKIETLITKQP